MSDAPAEPRDRIERIAEQVARIKSENVRLVERVAESERRFRRISRGVLRLQRSEPLDAMALGLDPDALAALVDAGRVVLPDALRRHGRGIIARYRVTA